MSILSALKQQNGSIDELAALPQTMIMQMVQKKQIDETMLAPILSRKAELAEATARTKAMQAGGQQPTVMEQLMAQNAQAEQPAMTDGRDMGIAQLPVEEPSYAGGGIVAFAEGGMSEDPMAYLSGLDTASLEQDQLRIDEILQKRNLAKAQEQYRFLQQSAPDAAAKMLQQNPNLAPKPAATSVATAPTPVAKEAGIKGLTSDKKAVVPTGAKSPADQITPPIPETSALDKLIAEYTSQLKVSPEAAKSARADARNQALLEAGLNIMGGTSPYAFANIGAGGAAAAKSYGESMKGIRADEAAKLNQLMSMGIKGETLKLEAKKLGITEKHYQDWYKAKMAEISESGATRKVAAQTNDDIKREQLAINRQKAADAALAASGYSMLAMSKKPEKQKQAADMKRDVYKQYGVESADTASPVGKVPAFNYVPGKGLVPVQ
jgi:hypothetical protein